MPVAKLAHLYAQQLRRLMPLVDTIDGEVYLLAPAHGYTDEEHRAALSSLVRGGTLRNYRYIDSKPQAAILAVPSRSGHP
ncbi:MAG: hypothetical protein EBT64_10175 [Gammaproteobacteria bacterium]|nr:hypothetical protein [Gammaproteobacteria bacterium]